MRRGKKNFIFLDDDDDEDPEEDEDEGKYDNSFSCEY
jgi:hypothetical protein